MTISDYKKNAVKKLSSITETPEFEAEQIMCYALNLNKNQLLFESKTELDEKSLTKLNDLFDRRNSREPLQYILGEWEFYGRKIYCGKGCLVPRPETEMLIDLAKESTTENGLFLDLCTGSGCISVSLLLERKDLKAYAVDISEKALEYTYKNVKVYNLQDRIKVICQDLSVFESTEKFNLIISNPPYIKSADMPRLSPEVKFEPDIALDGGEDGLVFYKIIIEKYSKYLADNGIFLFEVGYDIADDVNKLLKDAGFVSEIITDLYGNKRVCKAIKNKN